MVPLLKEMSSSAIEHVQDGSYMQDDVHLSFWKALSFNCGIINFSNKPPLFIKGVDIVIGPLGEC